MAETKDVYKELYIGKRIAVEIFFMAAIGLIFGFLGPFGTYAMPTAARLAYWVVFIVIGYAIFRPISLVSHWFRALVNIPLWLAELITSFLAALPLSMLIAYFMQILNPNILNASGGFGLLYIQCTAIGFAIAIVTRLLFREKVADGSGLQPDQSDQIASGTELHTEIAVKTVLHERLPAGFPEHIDALHAEDHYVHVYADGHKEMLLMRMSDAIKEIDNIDGYQIHRSWWVARHAVNTSKRDGRNLRLILRNGLEVPVSKPNVAKLKQLGWL